MSVLMLVAGGMFILFLLLVFMPKGKKPVATQETVAPQAVPQYFPQCATPTPAPQLTLRQQEIQEKVRVLTTHYLNIEEDQFKKKVVDEALALLSQGK